MLIAIALCSTLETLPVHFNVRAVYEHWYIPLLRTIAIATTINNGLSQRIVSSRQIHGKRDADEFNHVRICDIVLDISRMTLYTTYLFKRTHLEYLKIGIVPNIISEVSISHALKCDFSTP